MAGTILDHALAYAERGWPVFPCDPKTKRPLVRPDKINGVEVKGTGGLHKATLDAAQIRAWWKQWPKAMIGVPMGGKAGAFVIDLDLGDPPLVSGHDYLQRFDTYCGGLPDTLICETASGGIHLYFAWDATRPVKNNGKRLVPALTLLPAEGAPSGAKGAGVDCRGEGGYVIVPPSVRADGRPYSWLTRGEPAPATGKIWNVALGVDSKAKKPPAAKSAATPAAAPVIDRGDAKGVRAYALAALAGELRELARAVPGERNNAINTAAFSVGQLVQSGALDEAEARRALQGVVAAWDNIDKSNATIDRGLAGGQAKPRDLREVRDKAERRAAAAPRPPAPGGPDDYEFLPQDAEAPGTEFAATQAWPADVAREETGTGGSAADHWPEAGAGNGQGGTVPPKRRDRRRRRKQGPPSSDALNLECAFLPLTDLGNAERFAARNADRLLWCSAIGWLWWDEQRWSRKGADDQVRLAVHATVRAIRDEAEALRASGRDVVVGTKGKGDDKEDVRYSDLLERWAKTSEDASRLSPIAREGGPYLAVDVEELDADPFKINVQNGTLHVSRAGRGRGHVTFIPGHDPDDLITKLSPVDYSDRAPCPVFHKFLGDVQPKEENRRFLRAWMGLSLTGDASEQKLAIYWGKGQNGKSTLMESCAYIAGNYSTTVPIETFLDQGKGRAAGQATPDLAKLPGVRMLRTSEPDKGAKLAEAFIKAVTGGEPILARELHKPFFEFYPQFKLTVSGNYRPTILGTDKGIWRRVVLVPWTVTIKEEDKDPHLGAKLRGEASGILNWMLDGLCDWLDHGLMLPEDVKAATEQYQADSDPLGRFLADCVIASPGDRVQSTAMHQLFNAFAKANGEREWTAQGLGRALKERGFVSVHSNVNWWDSVRLVKTLSDYVDKDGNAIKQDGAAGDEGGGDAAAPGGPEDFEFH